MAMVSVIVPVYNAGKKIRDCIKSILRQSYRDIELIIIDDCSTDSTPEIIAKFSDPRIRCLKNDQNQGVEISRLRGLKAARGEYIMFVDADDWLLHRDVISHMVSKIEETRADYVEVGVSATTTASSTAKAPKASQASSSSHGSSTNTTSPISDTTRYQSTFGANSTVEIP